MAREKERIEEFLQACRSPALLEAGESLLPLAGNFTLERRGERLQLQAWSDSRNLVRRVLHIQAEERGRMTLVVERFPKRTGELQLVDTGRPAAVEWQRRSSRLAWRERLRLMLSRELPSWRIAALSTEPDLEHSLSPNFPRALLTRANQGIAVIAAPPGGLDLSGILTFGLIWLDYVRRRHPKLSCRRLSLWMPARSETSTALRLLWLDPARVQTDLYLYNEQDSVRAFDPADRGNIDTVLEPCASAAPMSAATFENLRGIPGLQAIQKPDGGLSLRIHGLEFARARAGQIHGSLGATRPLSAAGTQALARHLSGFRHAEAADRLNPLFTQLPEAWLESAVRAQLDLIDASLGGGPVYGQVPAFAAVDRAVLDLLTCDHTGRLAVLELKASADLHLPLQALDYWLRVRWHLLQGDFEKHGYFPQLPLRREPPRLILAAPALEFHPTTETILSYLSPAVEVTRVGLSASWRRELRVMFRLEGARQPYL